MRINKPFLFAALLILSVCLMSSVVQAQANNTVLIKDFAFQPNILTVPAGTTVTWTNNDPVPHTVVGDNGTFDSGNIAPSGQFTYTFNQPGNYSYYCRIHPYMFGQILVTQGPSMLKTMGANSGSDPSQTVTSYSQFSTYSQYFSMPGGSAPKTHITYPKNYPIKNLGSLFVYFTVPKYSTSFTQTYAAPSYSYQTYSMPYSQYQTSYATYTGSISLWVQGTSSLTQYVTVPQGASLSLVAISPTGGNGYLYEIAPGGMLNTNSYYFYQYNQMNFYADTIGQHVLLIVINDKVSNAIIINVIGSSYYSQPSYPPSNQPPSYSPPPSGGYSSGGY